jgi:hypothetical protein
MKLASNDAQVQSSMQRNGFNAGNKYDKVVNWAVVDILANKVQQV